MDNREMTESEAATLRLASKYIKPSYHVIIAALAERPMTVPELHGLLPDMTKNGVKHAIVMLRRCKAIYVKEWMIHPGQKQMLLALGDSHDAPQIRNARGRQLVPRRVKIAQQPVAMPPPKLPTSTPRLGMFGV